MNRRKIVSSLCAVAAAGLAGLTVLKAQAQSGASASSYPNKPVKILVGYAAGGAVDVIARALAQQLSASLNQSFVVENRPGAGSNIATRATIDAPADGYTLMLAANAIAANPTLYQPQPFDPEKELAAISLVGRVPVVIAASTQGSIDSLPKLIEQAKARPGALAYGSPGNGATPHMAIELFERAAGIQLLHVPYRGGALAITDVIGGQIPLVAVNALEVQPHVRSGRLRVLAALSPRRSPIYPDAPTIAESGFAGFEASVWYGLVAPASTPKDIVAKLHIEVQKALESKELRERLQSAGGEINPGSVEMFSVLIRNERQRYAKLIREANIKPD